MRDVHPAQDKLSPLGERMHIVPLPNTQPGRIENNRLHHSVPPITTCAALTTVPTKRVPHEPKRPAGVSCEQDCLSDWALSPRPPRHSSAPFM